MSVAETSFYVAGGTLRHDAASYVERRADQELHAGLTRGEFCYVLTSRQMGKSSLMVRTAARLREEGVAVVVLDLTGLGQNLSLEQWYDSLLSRLGRQLDMEDEMEDYWLEHERQSPLQRWMGALCEVALARCPGRIVIFVDEIDTVRSLPFSTDEFFAAIRECYNRRTVDPTLHRLAFCLLGVATPSDLIQDTRMTPFNIGRRIELTDFTDAEAAPLASGLLNHGDTETRRREEAEGQALLKRILYWTGGHPYLTQRLCEAVASAITENPKSKIQNPKSVDRLCEALFLSHRARERDSNLLFVRERLLHNAVDTATVLDHYLDVGSGRQVPDEETSQVADVLRLSGITRVVDGHLRVRNRIYERVFDREWVFQSMPDRELRLQQTARRRGQREVARVTCLLMAVLVLLLDHFTPILVRSELMTLDWRFVRRGPRKPGPDVALVTVDEKSLAELGSWPWPRSRHAELVDVLRQCGAAEVVFDIFFSEPQRRADDPKGDASFAAAMRRAGNVLLAAELPRQGRVGSGAEATQQVTRLTPGRILSSTAMRKRSPPTPKPLPRWMQAPSQAMLWTLPIPKLLEAAHGVGYVDVPADPDAIFRRAVPLTPVDSGRLYPHLAVLAAALKLGVAPQQIRADNPLAIHIGNRRTIPVSALGTVLIDFVGPPVSEEHSPLFPRYSYSEVLKLHPRYRGHSKKTAVGQASNVEMAPAAFRDKIVFVGATAPGLYDLRPSPYSLVNVGVETNANLTNAILQNRFFIQPGPWFLFVFIVAIALLASRVLAVQRMLNGTLIALGGGLGYSLIALWLFSAQRIILPMADPLLTLGLCYWVILANRALLGYHDGVVRRALRSQ